MSLEDIVREPFMGRGSEIWRPALQQEPSLVGLGLAALLLGLRGF